MLTAHQYRYPIVDYDRSNFTVYQALFPDNSVPQNLVSIYAENSSVSGNGSVPSPPSGDRGRHGLRVGAIVAIVVTIVAAIAVSILSLFIWRRRGQRRPEAPGELD